MSDVVLETHGLTREFSGFVAVNNVDLKVRDGSICALIGPNGAGKTTCFNLLTKFLQPTRGKIKFKGKDITNKEPAEVARLGVGRSFQISAVFLGLTALENVRMALQRARGESFDFWRSERVLDALRRTGATIVCVTSDSRNGRTRPPRSCPMDANALSKLQPRLRLIRNCCCSTSHPPEWRTRISSGSSL